MISNFKQHFKFSRKKLLELNSQCSAIIMFNRRRNNQGIRMEDLRISFSNMVIFDIYEAISIAVPNYFTSNNTVVYNGNSFRNHYVDFPVPAATRVGLLRRTDYTHQPMDVDDLLLRHGLMEGDDLSLRHGPLFRRHLNNLNHTILMELRTFIREEKIRQPLRLLQFDKYRSMGTLKMQHLNNITILSYERSICARFCYKKKLELAGNSEMNEILQKILSFYAFLMKGTPYLKHRRIAISDTASRV